jgi:genome maintenance exonuclease 1
MTHKLESVQTESGRYYRSPNTGKWYPSVTTVVNHETEEFWANWRKDPKNAEISRRACARGNALHTNIEEYLKEGTLPEIPLARARFQEIRPYLDRITKIHAIEQTLFSDQILMAGRVDCVGDYDGEIAIIDFKSSSKEKTESQIKNYFHQTTAYSMMWEEIYGQPVNKVVILMLTDDGVLQEFVRNPKQYRKSMLKVAKGYWEKNSFKAVQEKANELFEKTVR